MWDEIMDMPGEIFDCQDAFEALVEEMCNDPEFVAAVERNNAEWDAEVAQFTKN